MLNGLQLKCFPLEAVAFRTPSGDRVLVLVSNHNVELDIVVEEPEGKRSMAFTLVARSSATLIWANEKWELYILFLNHFTLLSTDLLSKMQILTKRLLLEALINMIRVKRPRTRLLPIHHRLNRQSPSSICVKSPSRWTAFAAAATDLRW